MGVKCWGWVVGIRALAKGRGRGSGESRGGGSRGMVWGQAPVGPVARLGPGGFSRYRSRHQPRRRRRHCQLRHRRRHQPRPASTVTTSPGAGTGTGIGAPALARHRPAGGTKGGNARACGAVARKFMSGPVRGIGNSRPAGLVCGPASTAFAYNPARSRRVWVLGPPWRPGFDSRVRTRRTSKAAAKATTQRQGRKRRRQRRGPRQGRMGPGRTCR